ncbi:uncharacterized protein J3D65DRAFT_666956 [Phyllosticta citribraziliensis]|uniref:DNA2/NAM7 helicase-like C-terminal domain-containing protein n=1 Tax=Phyllosticta citribraziliensis TaxID=989973 RepID=A0ABR1LU92_9PEZI
MADDASPSTAEDEMAVESSIVWPLKDTKTQKLVSRQMLNFSENCPAYHPQVAAVTEDYRGADAPSKKTWACRKLLEGRDAILCFGTGVTAGHFPKDTDAPKDITMRFRVHTQWPHLEITVWRRNEGNKSTADFKCLIFGDAIAQSSDALEIRSQNQITQSENELLYRRSSTPAQGDPTDTPFVTRIRVDSRTAPVQLDNEGMEDGEVENVYTPWVWERSGVVFVGLDDAEVTDMVHQYYGQDFCTRHLMPRNHKIVAQLACQGADLTIFQHRLHIEDIAALHQFHSYFVPIMTMCRDHGLLWFYRLQRPNHKEVSMASNEFPISGLQIPRWLVQSWWVATQEGSGVLYVPATWTSFTLPDQLPLPDLVMFLWRLGVQREREHQQQRFMMGPISDNHIATAEFIRCENVSNQYMVLVWLPAEYQDGETDLIPRVDARVSISVKDSLGELVECEGFVTENFHMRQANFSVFATVKGQNCLFEDLKQYKITINEVDDEISTSRQLKALDVVAHSPSTSFVDFRSLLGLPTRKSSNTTGLKGWFDEDCTRKERFLAVLERHSLNQLQSKAMTSMLDKSMTLLEGPAGTGKTKTLATTVEGLVAAGLRVLVVTNSNSPLDSVFHSFYKSLQAGHDKYCLFKGGRVPKDVRDSLENHQHDAASASDEHEEHYDAHHIHLQYQDLTSAMWTHFFSTSYSGNLRLEKYSYQAMLRAMIVRIGNSPQHLLHGKAVHYCQCVEALEDPCMLTSQRIEHLERAICKAEDTTFRAEFFSGVAVLFTTTSRSAHRILTDGGFSPDVLVMEEASQTSIPEGCVPLAAHPKIKAIVVLGDNQQQSPFLQSRLSSEMGISMSKSLLDVLQDREGVERVLLQHCYRMHPHIMEFPSQEFYKKSLKSQFNPDKELGQSLQSIFSSIDATVFSRRRRVAVDVSTTPQKDRVVYSEAYEYTKSSYNEFEADAVIATIKRLLAFRPSSSEESDKVSRQIQPSEIMVVTPYYGQRRVIIQKIRDEVPEANKQIRVLTSTQVSSSEANIVLFSLVSNKINNELSVSFIAQPKPLNAALTRAKEMLILFGNFGGWTRAIRAPKSDHATKGHWQVGAFGSLVRDLLRRKDVIDVDDYLAALEGKPVKKSLFAERTFVLNSKNRRGGHGGSGRGGRVRAIGTPYGVR